MNNNKGIQRANIAAFLCGAAVSILIWMVLAEVQDIRAFMLVSILLLSAAAAFLIIFLLDIFLVPYLSRRRAALRALGREGIRIVAKDKTAKLAYKGIYYLLGGKFPQAEDCLQQALALSDIRQNQMFCIEWLVQLYESTDNIPKMLWCFRKAAEYAPDNPEAQSRLGHAYFSDGKLDQAEYCFRQALKYDPNNGYSYFSLAKIQLVRGEDKLAFETLQNLLKINEHHPLCHAELADYYAMQGDREKAEEECRKAQLCGIKEPEELNKRINAMLSFHCTDYDGKDLPSMFYRKIEKKTQGGENKESTAHTG